MKLMVIGALIIGDEILSGKRTDGHFAKVREVLAQRGLAPAWVRYAGDDRPLLTATLRETFATGDVVFRTYAMPSYSQAMPS